MDSFIIVYCIKDCYNISIDKNNFNITVKRKLSKIKSFFPFFRNNCCHYLDNAATTQKAEVVLDVMDRWYRFSNANVHRGIYNLAEQATDCYEESRHVIADFLNADASEIVFVSGATAGLNMVSYAYEHMINKGDRIVTTALEHHSNFLPWQRLADKKEAEFVVIPVWSIGP